MGLQKHRELVGYKMKLAAKFEILLSDIKDYAIIPLGSLDYRRNAFINISNLWRRSCILSTLILVFWTSRSLYLNNSSIWDHKHNNYRNFTKNNLWEPINDLCHELYFSSWKCCLGTSYVCCRFRNLYKSLFYRSYNLDILTDWYKNLFFGNQSMIFAMSCISLLGSVVWGHHMYAVGLETDTRAYFTGVTILISLPTGTKIFNWLS